MVAPTSSMPCPKRNTLIEFNCGRLTVPDLETIAEHLTVCDGCLDALSAIQNRAAENGVDAWLRAALEEGARSASGPSAATAAAETRTDWGEGARGGEERGDALVGTTLGPYQLLAVLGEGGMGVVYRAAHEPVQQLVALKTIRGRFGSDSHRLARFRTEGAALARLNHPNVVRLYHFDADGGRPFFTMELVTGGDLGARLDAGPLAFTAAAELVRTLAGAVAYLHAEQVVHRDLKPHNVLLTADGVPKVSDLGLAKLLDTESELTITGQLMGTPNYMSPEQAQGLSDEIGPMTDVYALGGILYACLTGRPPFEGKTRQEILAKVSTRDPEPPAKRRAEVPADLEAVCLKCLEKEPQRRYRSAEALADDLGRWLRGEPTLARPLTRTRRALRWVRRNARRGAATAAVLVLAVAVGIAVAPNTRSVGGTTVGDRTDLAPEKGTDADLAKLTSEAAKRGPRGSVTLIGKRGKPNWFRWKRGRDTVKIISSDDDTFTIVSPEPSLVELLPDPQTERYVVRAQVRHSRSERDGAVGLYVGRVAHPGGPGEINVYTMLAFNDVVRPMDGPTEITFQQDGIPVTRVLKTPNPAPQLAMEIASENGRPPNIQARVGLRAGVPSPPIGENQDRWRALEIVVTPEQVIARWEDQPSLSVTDQWIIQQLGPTLDEFRKNPIHNTNPDVRTLQPRHTPRGGLGLYLSRGWASFREVIVTPLPTPEKPR